MVSHLILNILYSKTALTVISKKYIVNPFSYNIQVISNEVILEVILDEVSLRITKTRIFSLLTKS